jgi:hypothetical protein
MRMMSVLMHVIQQVGFLRLNPETCQSWHRVTIARLYIFDVPVSQKLKDTVIITGDVLVVTFRKPKEELLKNAHKIQI